MTCGRSVRATGGGGRWFSSGWYALKVVNADHVEDALRPPVHPMRPGDSAVRGGDELADLEWPVTDTTAGYN